MWFDFLSVGEAEFTQHCLETLYNVPWAQPLLQRVKEGGGLARKNMTFLLEARYAHELHCSGSIIDYEYSAGVGGSTIDFRIRGNPDWFVEIVMIGESQAAKTATFFDGVFTSRQLTTPRPSSTKDERKQSSEGEMLLVEQKICAKVIRGEKPIKFPKPEGAYHLILVDMRAYLSGGDNDDYSQIAGGARAVSNRFNIFGWPNPKTNRMEPIKGLFESTNPLAGSKLVQERIHFLGFVAEKEYRDGEISSKTSFRPNPNYFSSGDEVRQALKTYPLFEFG